MRDKIARILLVFFLIYAVSPVYSSLSANTYDNAEQCHHSSETKFGITLIQIFASAFGFGAGNDPEQNDIDFILNNDDDHEATCSDLDVKPFLVMLINKEPVTHPITARSLFNPDTNSDTAHQPPDGFPALNPGLSPPLF